MFLPVFHLSVVALNSFSLWYDQTYVVFPFNKAIQEYNAPFNSRILFLTMWCLVLQTVYFAIAFLNDIFGTNDPVPKQTSLIRLLKDTVFSLAFPIALYVFLTFWGIYAIDRELIFPVKLEKSFPVWLNQVMHSFILPFILTDLLLTSRNYPSRKCGITLMVAFTTAYTVVLYIVGVKTGSFVYPVLDVMNWPLRIIFFAVSIGFGIGMYVVGETLNAVVSTKLSKELKGKSKKKH